MNVIQTDIMDLLIIEPDIFGDNRGYFTETYNKIRYEEHGIKANFVQDNMSFSAQKGTFRGFHWQNPPFAQAKLVSVSKGVAIDIAIDIRKGSPTYGKWICIELSAQNHKQIFIPHGFAHGFITISDDVEFRYKCDNIYNKAYEAGMRYDAISIDWRAFLNGSTPILSQKDMKNPSFDECNNGFIYRKNC